MGEFTTRIRHFGAIRPTLIGGTSYACADHADYVYSWRSRRTKHDIGDKEAGTIVGIRPPSMSGNLLDVLSDRKRFTEDIMSTMGGQRSNTLPVTRMPTCLTTDNGHPFTSVKFRTQSVGRITIHRNGNLWSDSPMYALTTAVRQREITSTPGFPSTILTNTPTALERNARLNPVFAEMLPTKHVAQIGETVVSLLRGEFPQLLRNIGKLLEKLQSSKEFVKGATSLVGGEYLNSVFGWQPLINDLQRAISVLTTVDHLIYGTSFRRHRTIKWDSSFSEVTSNVLAERGTSYGPKPVSASYSIPAKRLPFRNSIMSYDARLSAKLVPIARPGIGANKFIDEAVDKLEALGLWYPALGWDLLPYSWLIDWATSLGSSITNASKYGSKPGQVNIDYCWITTCAKLLVTVGFSRGGEMNDGSGYTSNWSGLAKSIVVSKTRFPSTPFGVGLDLSTLNAAQIQILIALGLARIR